MTTTSVRTNQLSWQNRAVELGKCILGIMISYILSSFLQEKITQQKYGTKSFVYMQNLVLAQCSVSALVALFFRTIWHDKDNVPWRMYATCSGSYVLAMLCSNLALEYINYPTQVMAKSCKPIPILLAGVLFAHKSYPWRKYLYILMIVVGMGFCMYKDKPGKAHGGFSFGQGEMFLLFSLTMDGVTGAVQDRIRHYHVMGTYTMMFYMNIISSCFLGVSVVLTGELVQFLQFVYEFPHVIRDICLFAIASASGQCFIFKTVTEFGPLTCSILTNLRKLFTVILSIVVFSHPYSYREAIGASIVFAALFFDAYDSKKSHHKRLAQKVEK
ncbi:Solute carrier family 35 member B1 [Aphelenchoides besseyi]|nr:Solute carrier family 35 member B1 [Aphelenchoides besseyi]KAI6237195.1 Solute carrier family 35 member B1 [Aphelenchoides besseyi]